VNRAFTKGPAGGGFVEPQVPIVVSGQDRLLDAPVGTRMGPDIVLGQGVGRRGRVSPGRVRTGIRALGGAPGFDATLHRRYQATHEIDVPTTLAFGSLDRPLVSRRWRRLDELPREPAWRPCQAAATPR
jgi:hypothetical protein